MRCAVAPALEFRRGNASSTHFCFLANDVRLAFAEPRLVAHSLLDRYEQVIRMGHQNSRSNCEVRVRESRTTVYLIELQTKCTDAGEVC